MAQTWIPCQGAPKDAFEPFDSNTITLGTPFMAWHAGAIRVDGAEQVDNSSAWKNLGVILSDSSVPDEGEHKIVEFIHIERSQLEFDPNIHHVMHGLDADLIMLVFSANQVRFSILRADAFPKRGDRRNGKQVRPSGSATSTHRRAKLFTRQDCLENLGPDIAPMYLEVMRSQGLSPRSDTGKKKAFQFLHINILREYHDAELKSDIVMDVAALLFK